MSDKEQALFFCFVLLRFCIWFRFRFWHLLFPNLPCNIQKFKIKGYNSFWTELWSAKLYHSLIKVEHFLKGNYKLSLRYIKKRNFSLFGLGQVDECVFVCSQWDVPKFYYRCVIVYFFLSLRGLWQYKQSVYA